MLEFMIHLPQTNWAEILGWTLIHSLWQGSLIAILLAMSLKLFKIRAARLRYTLALVALLLIPGLSVLTVMSDWVQPNLSSYESAVLFSPSATATLSPSDHLSVEASSVSIWSSISALNWHAVISWLPLIWLPGVLFFSLRSIGGIWYAQRIRKWGSSASISPWQTKIEELSHYLGIRRTPELKITRLLQTPVVIGHIRPVILIPFSMITGLNPKQIEAILAHELAHIYRNDYLVNMLQTGIESLFFYHPAVWWISGLIRTEREHCCDDIAVQLSDNPFEYAQALAELEASYLSTPTAALALDGHGKPLLRRIQRLLQPERMETGGYSHILMIALFGIMFMSFVGFRSVSTPINQENQILAEREKDEMNDQLEMTQRTYSISAMESITILGWRSKAPAVPSHQSSTLDSVPIPHISTTDVPPVPPLVFPFESVRLPEADVEKQRQFILELETKWEAMLYEWEQNLKIWLEEYQKKTIAQYMKGVDEDTWNSRGSHYWQDKAQAETDRERNRALEQAYKAQHIAQTTFAKLRSQVKHSQNLLSQEQQYLKEQKRRQEKKLREEQLFLMEQELKQLERLMHQQINEENNKKQSDETIELIRNLSQKRDDLKATQQKMQMEKMVLALKELEQRYQATQQLSAAKKLKTELELKETIIKQERQMAELVQQLEALQASAQQQAIQKKKKEEQYKLTLGADPSALARIYENMGVFQLALSRSLVSDRIIRPGVKNIHIQASRKGMKVNGKKLDRHTSNYYKEFIQKNGITMSPGTTLKIKNTFTHR